MNILITGANGFLGSHLVKHFVNLNYNVFALVRKNSNLARLSQLKFTINLQLLYIEDGLDDILNENKIDTVIHTATNYGRNKETFIDMANANEVFPLQLLENLPKERQINFINTHSSLPPLANPYAVSKSNFINWGKLLANEGKLKFINLRLEHFYGFGDDKSKFIEYITTSLINNVESLDLTKGEQQRDFIYIEDVVSAYHIILENITGLEGDFIELDIGTGITISIRDLVLLIKKLTNNIQTKLNFGAVPYRKNELMKSKANISEMAKLGWKVKFNITEGLERYIKETS